MAPLTAAERKRRSRAKQSEEKKNAERKKAKLLMQVLRKERGFDIKQKKKEREASKLRMRKMREKKKEIPVASSSTETVFSSRQSLGKALKKSKNALPQSPRKKVEIIKKIASELGLSLPSAKLPSNCVSSATKQKAIDFYYNDDISRILPGKKDVKSVKDALTNKKVKLQKRLLMYNLREVYELFKTDNPNETIGLSTFCQLRPEEVQTVGSKDQEVCCCPYCENVAFLLKKCKWNTINIQSERELISLIVCDQENADCMKQKCEKCKDKFEEFIVEYLDLGDQDVSVDITLLTM